MNKNFLKRWIFDDNFNERLINLESILKNDLSNRNFNYVAAQTIEKLIREGFIKIEISAPIINIEIETSDIDCAISKIKEIESKFGNTTQLNFNLKIK